MTGPNSSPSAEIDLYRRFQEEKERRRRSQMESSNCVEHNTSTAQQTDGAKDAASGDTAENQEEEVGETSRIVIENLSCF